MTELPQPLTPFDCNLRGFPWMALDTVRLLDSDLFLLASGDEFKAALALWCKSWSQVPAASLPNDDRLLSGLSGAKNWKKVRDIALRGWVLCSDNRFYHPVVAEKALEALPAMKAHSEQKQASKDRKTRERADRARIFEILREHNIVPEYNTKTEKLRELVAPFFAAVTADMSQHVTRDMSQHVTAIRIEEKTEENSTVPLTTSVPDGTGAAAPSPAEMTKAELWAAGKSLLSSAGMPAAQCGSFVGKLVKDYTDAIVVEAVRTAVVEQPADPASFLKACCQRLAGERRTGASDKFAVGGADYTGSRAAAEESMKRHGITPETDDLPL